MMVLEYLVGFVFCGVFLVGMVGMIQTMTIKVGKELIEAYWATKKRVMLEVDQAMAKGNTSFSTH